ncbi:unnamed protein product [Thlaspi arvense]|uniref:Uncharacterized protein n=1 Tax=Thlaspi arvense TaxID=13288 RepID=A0AAU9T560_THLAR|nr:unnamed protein product [Thlaspi arvense]
MGRYSYSQPSSSSRRLWNNGEPEVSSTPLRRFMSFEIPNRCYCGLLTVMRPMDRADEYLVRMFFGCKDYKYGPPHLVKLWDEAVMEEFQELQCALDNQGDCVRVLQNGDGQEAQNRIEAELAQLKELIVYKKSLRCLELRNVIVLSLVFVVLIICLCASLSRS